MTDASIGSDQGVQLPASPFPDGGEEKNITVVGIGPRLVARLLDTVLIAFLSIMLAAVVGIVGGLLTMYSSNSTAWTTFFTVAGGLVFSLAYYIKAWSTSGQTLGDTMLSVKVVTAQGAPPSMGQAILRYIGYVVSALLLSIGFVWIAIDKQRQGWHDKIARTYVIPADQSFSDSDRVTFTPTDSGSAIVWIGAWIVLAVFAPSALGAALWTLGPFVDAVVKNVRGG